MRFIFQRPDLDKALAVTEKDIEHAVNSGMRDAADGLKQDLREDILAAGLGDRLSRTWRGKTFPEVGESAEAAACVWSRAPKIVDAFDRGVVIRSARGLFLTIPTAAAGKGGRSAVGSREKITPEGWQQRTGLKLRFVYRRGRLSLTAADAARAATSGLLAGLVVPSAVNRPHALPQPGTPRSLPACLPRRRPPASPGPAPRTQGDSRPCGA